MQRVAPSKSLKAAVITVGRDPFATGFDGEGREKSIRDQITLDPGFLTQAAKDVPVAWPGCQLSAIGLIPQFPCEGQRLPERARRIENFRVCHDTQKATEHKVRHTECLIRIDEIFQPATVCFMVRSILPMRIN